MGSPRWPAKGLTQAHRCRSGRIRARAPRGRRSLTLSDQHQDPHTDGSLHADCANCFGLCCVALPFAASADFAVDRGRRMAVHQPAGRLPLRHPRTAARARLSRLHRLRLLRRRAEGLPAHLRRQGLAPGPAHRNADVRGVPRHAPAPRTALVPQRSTDPSGGPARPR